MRLIAVRSVLFRSVQHGAGDSLPADNEAMVEAWLSAGSAVWKEDDEDKDPPKKARLKTAPPGTEGASSDGDPEARVGRLPDRPERKKGARKK